MRLALKTSDEDDAAAPQSFFQSRFWASFKAAAGWKPLRFTLSAEGRPDASFSVMERSLPFGMSFAYSPHCAADELAELARALKAHVSKRCVFIRFDPASYCVGSCGCRPRFSRPLVKGADVQPPDSVVLDTTRTQEELLSAMKPKWRYNIRLAEKRGVEIRCVSSQSQAETLAAALEAFYSMYTTTAARDKIAIHTRSYYELLFSMKQPAGEPLTDVRLWTASYQGAAIAAIITVFYGAEAVYVYGASGDEERNRMPTYALQWAAICAAREAGCSTYDLYGIPPTDDEQHPMAGLYRFKTGFGGEIRHYAGGWDYPFKPFLYAAYRCAERARLFWYKVIKKKL